MLIVGGVDSQPNLSRVPLFDKPGMHKKPVRQHANDIMADLSKVSHKQRSITLVSTRVHPTTHLSARTPRASPTSALQGSEKVQIPHSRLATRRVGKGRHNDESARGAFRSTNKGERDFRSTNKEETSIHKKRGHLGPQKAARSHCGGKDARVVECSLTTEEVCRLWSDWVRYIFGQNCHKFVEKPIGREK